MARARYWMHWTGHGPIEIDEEEFLKIPQMVKEFDLLLWVDDSIAMCSKRWNDLVGRSTSKRYPDRWNTDGELRPASARTLLAVLRSTDWLTASEAFRLGNPGAAEPTERNAFVTFSKGRQLLDIELGHERWRAFGTKRRSLASGEFSVRFEPPPDLRWLVAWSELEPAPTPLSQPTPLTQSLGKLPVADLTRQPLLMMFMGLEIVILDAFLHHGRDEVVLLLSIDGTNFEGPATLEHVSVVTDNNGGELTTIVRNSLYASVRVEVPGESVVRLASQAQALPEKVRIPLGCVALRFASSMRAGSAHEVTRNVLIGVRMADGRLSSRRAAVVFRVLDPRQA